MQEAATGLPAGDGLTRIVSTSLIVLKAKNTAFGRENKDGQELSS